MLFYILFHADERELASHVRTLHDGSMYASNNVCLHMYVSPGAIMDVLACVSGPSDVFLVPSLD